jgi:carbon-monoxide dehydrogenase medium subunit
MKWPSFDYLKASSVGDALAALHEHGGEARLLAGGQSLMPMLALHLAQPSVLVDINDIPSLQGIRITAGNLVLGAATRYSSIERSAEVKTHCPFLAEVVGYIGDRQIRSRGSAGGALAQADTSGELVLAAIALGASVLVEGPLGSREIPASELLIGSYETDLKDDEMIVEISLPIVPGRRHVFHELAHRHGDYAVLAVGALGTPVTDESWRDVRLIVGGCGAMPMVFSPHHESDCDSVSLDEEIISNLADIATEGAKPSTDIRASADYRKAMVPVLAKRALRELRGSHGAALTEQVTR